MAKRSVVTPAIPEVTPQEKEKLSIRFIANQSFFNESNYEFDETFKAGNPSQFESVHTIPELFACLESNESVEAEGVFLEVNSDGVYKYKKFNTKAQILEAAKKNSRVRKMREAKFHEDAFARDNHGLIGDDFVPLLGGPFFKQQYLYDYLRSQAYCNFEYNHNPLARAIVHITRDFVLGRGFRVDCDDPKALALWQAFAEVNKIEELIEAVVKEGSKDGETMLWWLPNQEVAIGYQDAPGQQPQRGIIPRIRLVDPSTCWEIVTFPEDITRVLFYWFVFPCLHGDTKISLLDGREVKIRELAEQWSKDQKPVAVYSFNQETRRVEASLAHTIVETGRKRCVKVTLDNGESVIASYDHPFLTRSGEYVWAENLVPGQSLMPLYRDKNKAGYERVYQPNDKKTQYTHHMVAESLLGGRTGKIIHHIDHDKSNNDPENLSLMGDKEHRQHHAKENWSNPEYVKKCNEARQAAMQTESYRAAMSLAKTGFVFTEESLLKRSKSQSKAWETSEKLSAVREQRTEYFQSKEGRESARSQMKTAWADPEFKNSRIQALKDSWKRRKEKTNFPNNHKVVSVEPAGDHVVYDMTVEGNHNFALTAGVFTHNTQYQIKTGMAAGSSVPTSKFIMQQIPAEDMQHIKYNANHNEKRGRSDLFPVLGYLKWVKDFINYKLVSMKKQAAWTEDISVAGSQSDVDNLSQALASLGEFEPAGSRFVHTDKITRQYLNTSNNAGGEDHGVMHGIDMIAAGSQIPVSYFGLSKSAGQTRASALVGTEPVAKKFERRQQEVRRIIDSIWRKFQTRYGVEGSECKITFPEIIAQDRTGKLKDIKMVEDAGYISRETAALLASKELDIDNYDYEVELQKIAAENPQPIFPNLISPLTAAPAAPAAPKAPDTSGTPSTSAVTQDERSANTQQGRNL